MNIKISDYIIEFLLSKNINKTFGYIGGAIAHIYHSIDKYKCKLGIVKRKAITVFRRKNEYAINKNLAYAFFIDGSNIDYFSFILHQLFCALTVRTSDKHALLGTIIGESCICRELR